MVLSKLLEHVAVSKMFQTLYGQMVVTHDVEIRQIAYDSRRVEAGDVFVAIRGTGSDGHDYIQDAIHRGAKAVVVETDASIPDSYCMHAGAVKIVVPHSRVALAAMASAYYGNPSEKLTVVGVTGTNGKTTTTHLLKSILEGSGSSVGLIGTIHYMIGKEILPATHTTPESLELQELLARMVNRRCSAAVMEVSSHALHQHRVDGLRYRAAVFTNLTQDHLDYHGTMENYFKAKSLLFEHLESDAWAMINADDPWSSRMSGLTRAHTLTYGFQQNAEVCAANVSLSLQGTTLTIRHQAEESVVSSPLVGRFNASNLLASFAAGIALSVPKQLLCEVLRHTPPVRGRFEPVVSPTGWTAIIDYAHTPDALEKALMAVRDLFAVTKKGKIITVFGCGGNRDRTKRPKMANIATRYSDYTIITSDNPRHEEPDMIIEEAAAGAVAGSSFQKETDRRRAIVLALDRASANDVILIAGKGHEEYQIVGDMKLHFSDREIVEEFLGTPA